MLLIVIALITLEKSPRIFVVNSDTYNTHETQKITKEPGQTDNGDVVIAPQQDDKQPAAQPEEKEETGEETTGWIIVVIIPGGGVIAGTIAWMLSKKPGNGIHG